MIVHVRHTTVILTVFAGLLFAFTQGKAQHPMKKRITRLIDQFEPIKESDLSAFEAELGGRLPEDYRVYLLNSNGGRFEFPNEFPIKAPGKRPGVNSAGHFYALKTKRDQLIYESNELRWSHRVWLGRIPRDMLAIANDGFMFRDQICIGIHGPRRGKIYYWNREYELAGNDEEGRRDLSLVADSFSDWVNSIVFSPEKEIEKTKQKSPLCRAVILDDREEVVRLLKEGANPNEACEKEFGHKWTPLMAAARYGRLEMIELLIRHGANPNQWDENGSVLTWACGVDSIKTLVKNGANINSRGEGGVTPLIELMGLSNPRMLKLFLDLGANPHARDDKGKSVWDHAVENERLEEYGDILREALKRNTNDQK